jgi:hypothetical protein
MLVFSLFLMGTVRASEARRERLALPMIAWGSLALLTGVAFLAICAVGIVFITSK